MKAWESDPLQVFLQHSRAWQRDQQLLCKLLCLSKGVRAGLRQKHSGKARVTYAGRNTDRIHEFTPWLAKHGILLESLQLDINLCGSSWHETEAAVASALQQAAADAPFSMLQLKEYSSNPACDGAVLTQLPGFYLTSLEFGPRAAFSSTFALEQLTRLRSLALAGDSADNLISAMPSMTCLTRLALHGMAAATLPKLKQLPAQLLRLEASLSRLRKAEALAGLQLGHLTALTELSSGGAPLVVQKGDELPPNLVVLRVRDVKAAAPLLPLQRLQLLDMHLSTTLARELLALGQGLPQLREVQLGYSDLCDWSVKAAAPGWPALPLKRLEFRGCDGRCDQSVLEQLPKLQRLSCLEVYGGLGCCRFAGVLDATPHALSSVLRQMTALEELGLRGITLQPEHEPAEEPQQQQQQQHADEADSNGTAVDATSSMPPAAAAAEGGEGGSPAAASEAAGLSLPASLASSGSSASSSSCSSSSSAADGALELMAAIASLPHLHQLAFCGVYAGPDSAGPTAGGSRESQLMQLDPAAASQLAAATQLTGLFLVGCGLDDDAVNTLAGTLKNLRVLKIDANPLVTSDVLPDGAKQLSSLRELCVLRTGIRQRARSFKQRLEAMHPGLNVKSSAR